METHPAFLLRPPEVGRTLFQYKVGLSSRNSILRLWLLLMLAYGLLLRLDINMQIVRKAFKADNASVDMSCSFDQVKDCLRCERSLLLVNSTGRGSQPSNGTFMSVGELDNGRIVCLFRFIHTVWHTCEYWREQDPKCSSADGSPLSREYNSNIVLANLKLI